MVNGAGEHADCMNFFIVMVYTEGVYSEQVVSLSI